MRYVSLLLAFVAACSGGGSSAPPTPPDLNPAPAPAGAASVDMDGYWTITDSTLAAGSSPGAQSMPVGTVLRFFEDRLYSIQVPGGSEVQIALGTIEGQTGFPVDYYENEGDTTAIDFGFGWDRLRVPGGGGQYADYYFYGIRVAPVGETLLIGYEGEERQPFLGQPRTEWAAALILARVPD